MMKQSSRCQDERIPTPREWAQQQFGSCDLGDRRRTRRLVSYAALQMENPEASTNSVCQGNDAAAEGAYRLLRNEEVKPEAIEEGPFRYTAEQTAKRDVVLAIQDTSSVSYPHSVQQLGDLGGGSSGDKGRGFWVHSTLMVDGQTYEPVGLIDQVRWMREKGRKPSRYQRKERPYEDKESYKWQQAHERMTARLSTTTNVVSVADREADVFQYLQYLDGNNQRFVVRAAQNRSLETLETTDGRLWEFMAKQPVVTTRIVDIRQRGAQRATSGQKKRPARRARKARLQVRVAETTLRVPNKSRAGEHNPIPVRIVYLVETDQPEGQEPCEWMLLTTEPIDMLEQVNCIIGYYEARWLIEDFHKAWKTGCGVELRRQQSVDNLERVMVILVPMAVQILRLRTLAQSDSSAPCDTVLNEDQWHCLYVKSPPKKRTTKRKPRLPRKPPTLAWALESIAKLGGWRRTKQNPLPGWITLWRGWLDLERYVEGWRLARSANR